MNHNKFPFSLFLVLARGPALGGCMSRRTYRFVRDTQFCTDVGAAVRPRHAGDSWFDRARSALSNQLSATSWLSHHEPGEVQNHQYSGIRRASASRRGCVVEWLQPSGRRPEGCCRSTELSGGRGQLPEVADYRLRRTMHAPCMPRLTLADVWRRQPESHESFEVACRNAAGRCSTSVSMCSTRAVQRKQRRSDAEGRECSSPHTHRVAPAALWTLCSDASGHDRPIPPTCGLF